VPDFPRERAHGTMPVMKSAQALGSGSSPASLLACALLASAAGGCRGSAHDAGEIRGRALPPAAVAARDESRAAAAAAVAARGDDGILFGDLHLHSTFSADAYLMSLPLMQGEGVHPVADACDFARYCSALDFWGITDHAESLTPRRWRETIDSIRQCDTASAGSKVDLVSFLGFEWTQIGMTADEHYGHRNVILRDLEDGKIPLRPVGAAGFAAQVMSDKLPWVVRYLLPEADWRFRGRYLDFLEYWRETRETEECPPGVDVRDVRGDCMDFTKTPAELFEKLRQWGVTATVIPHGTTWGIYTPPGYFPDKSLRTTQNDERQRLIEVFSGDGNSEQYRPWREANVDPEGHMVCPRPTADYEPCCWRAGEIVRSRCSDPRSDECRTRVEDARRNYLAAGATGALTVSGADVAAWGACGQCLDCFNPTFEYRPGGSVQYALALTDFNDPVARRRFRFGFVASSDNHSARGGSGYKEFLRPEMTDSFGPRSSFWRDQARPLGEPRAESEAIDPKNNRFQRYQLLDFERGSSFLYTGGLVAVHAKTRERAAIWDALERREVYATSGERILLWFDLVQGERSVASMGAALDWPARPRFRVRAVGSPEQLPGCPDYTLEGIDADKLHELCRGECYNPGSTRRPIDRVEVVRIRPQVRPGEPVAGLIEDPWKTLACADQGSGCVAEFDDADFLPGARDVLYYVRAIQRVTPAVNAGGLRCTGDDKERCSRMSPCYGDWRTPPVDDCLSANEERAWSSPIYLGWSVGTDARRSSSPR